MKTFFKVIAWIIATPFVVWGLWWSYWTYTVEYAPYRGMKFNKDAWFGDDGEGGKIWPGTNTISYGKERCKMYADLATNHLRRGMKLEEIEKLLGSAWRIYYCLEKRVKCLLYFLHTCYSGYSAPSSGSLVICFNDRQEVIEWDKYGTSSSFPALYDKMCGDSKYASCPVNDTKEQCSCTKKKQFEDGMIMYSYYDCTLEKW